MTDPLNRRTIVERPPADAPTPALPGSDAAGPPAPSRRTIVKAPPGPVTPGAGRQTTVAVPESKEPPEAPSGPQSAGAAAVFRSLVRPPMALLTALDDGCTDTGETWRLRKARTTIGRVAGDIQIAHDPDISAEHAEVVRRELEGGHQWHLIDLGSTNGTFLRVPRIILRNGKELLVGNRRLVFSSPDVVGSLPTEALREEDNRQTRPHAAASPADLHRLGPRLSELTPRGYGAQFSLPPDGCQLGRDPGKCPVMFLDDPFLDAVHASISRDARGRWIIRDLGSVNGLWMRISQAPLDPEAQFLVGGQRFQFRLP